MFASHSLLAMRSYTPSSFTHRSSCFPSFSTAHPILTHDGDTYSSSSESISYNRAVSFILSMLASLSCLAQRHPGQITSFAVSFAGDDRWKPFDTVWSAKEFREILYHAIAPKAEGPLWFRESLRKLILEDICMTQMPHVRSSGGSEVCFRNRVGLIT